MTFNKGDKVKIKNLVAGQYYGEKLVRYSPNLKKYTDEILTISEYVGEGKYEVESLELDNEEIDEIFLTPVIEKVGEMKFGDIVTFSNGEKYVIADKTFYGEYREYEHEFLPYKDSEDEPIKEYSEKIEKIERAGEIIYNNTKRKMTLKEIEEELGYKVEIIDV